MISTTATKIQNTFLIVLHVNDLLLLIIHRILYKKLAPSSFKYTHTTTFLSSYHRQIKAWTFLVESGNGSVVTVMISSGVRCFAHTNCFSLLMLICENLFNGRMFWKGEKFCDYHKPCVVLVITVRNKKS